MKKPIVHYGVKEVIGQNPIMEDDTLYEKIENYVWSLIKNEYGNLLLDRDRITVVEGRVDALEREVTDLKNAQGKVLIIEEMDMETAKKRVLEYTEKHRVFDIEELHQNIRCELKLLIKIIDELKKEGRIKEEV